MAKKLYRSRQDRMIAGVCGGIGEYTDIDPTWIRLAWVLLVLASGIGVLLYIIAVIIIPENPAQKKTKSRAEKTAAKLRQKPRDAHLILGLGLVAIGAILLLDNFVLWLHPGMLLPVILLGVGAYLLVQKK